MSALPPKADMCSANRDVRFGPIADIGVSDDLKLVCLFALHIGLPMSAIRSATDIGSLVEIQSDLPGFLRGVKYRVMLNRGTRRHETKTEAPVIRP
jgi:hypothetical protein